MTKFLTAMILTASAFGAQAASHTGGAPMKADAAASAASAPTKAAKPAHKAKAAASAPMKAEATK